MATRNASYDFLIKLLLIGDSGHYTHTPLCTTAHCTLHTQHSSRHTNCSVTAAEECEVDGSAGRCSDTGQTHRISRTNRRRLLTCFVQSLSSLAAVDSMQEMRIPLSRSLTARAKSMLRPLILQRRTSTACHRYLALHRIVS